MVKKQPIMKTILLFILLFSSSLCSRAQNNLGLVTIKAHNLTRHEIDSALNGTWDYIANDTVHFLNFNHHLLFQYKGKGIEVIWDKLDKMYSVYGKIDTVLYKAFSIASDVEMDYYELVYIESKTTQDSYDTYSTVEYQRIFGSIRLLGDTLTLSIYNSDTHKSSEIIYHRLPNESAEK